MIQVYQGTDSYDDSYHTSLVWASLGITSTSSLLFISFFFSFSFYFLSFYLFLLIFIVFCSVLFLFFIFFVSSNADEYFIIRSFG